MKLLPRPGRPTMTMTRRDVVSVSFALWAMLSAVAWDRGIDEAGVWEPL